MVKSLPYGFSFFTTLTTTKMRTYFISFSILLLSINFIFAQNKAENGSIIENLNEVVISAQITPRSEKNSVYKVKVITTKTIEKKASNNLRELLQQELNIDLSQNSVFGSSVEIQGISKENIKILIDGTPVIGRLNGVIDLSQINLQNIERIEVIEGPVSVFYGTDAMGGVINLITKKSQKNTIDGNISLYYESINATNINVSFGYKFGNNIIRLNGGNYKFNGHSSIDAVRNLNWEEKNQHFSNLLFIKKIKKLQLRFSSSFTNEILRSLGEPDRTGNIQDKNYHTRRFDNSISLQGEISGNKFIDTTISYLDYQRYHNTFNIDPLSFAVTNADTDNKDDNIVQYNYAGFKTQLGKSKFDDKLNYAIGTDIKTESTKGERILNIKQNIQTYAIFSSLNYHLLEKIEIQPAIRYTYNSSYGSLVSPAFNSKIKINNNNNIRFSYARGYRAPSLKELFLDFHIAAGPFTYIISGNENLEVEKSHSFNLHYSYNKLFNNSKSMQIEPALFYNNISNLIALSELVDFKRYYININRFKSVGVKVDFSYINTEKVSFNTGISLIGRYNRFTESFNTDEFFYAPEITSNINYQIKYIGGLSLNLFYKYTGKRSGYIIDENLENLTKVTRKDFNNLDLSLSKSFLHHTLNASLGIKNIFDVEDIETTNQIGEAHSRDLQLWGTTIFFKASYNF
jgi:outer membrane receptor for ferrienterochelin and colicins